MGDFDDDDFDVGDFFDIIIPLLTNILIVVLCFWLCFKCCKCRRNEGAVIATPAVVITSTQHYPAAVAATGPNPGVAPAVFMPPNANASTAGYQQLQQQQKPATAPPLMDLASQDPPTYEEAVGAGQQPQFNPHYPRQ
ncbi:protein shisa-5-like isoform X2 [Culex quinquefasciatus]|uniref:protein shisa-5-like isoform X2 n=1 Tax=Culex quinquefasciatus TaxID=7176 RepID=UPI0018E3C81B|nr:protein shisa-5-like isoform X2 [Culex quinquefasciatus]